MNFVDLPVGLEVAIAGVIALAFKVAVQFILAKIPWLGGFLSNYANEWALAISAAFIFWLENALPSDYPDVAVLVIELLLAVIAALGFVNKFLKRRGFVAFQ